MDMPDDTRDRIFKAAETLFIDTGRDSFPTVDAVRRAARVSMGDASTAMKAWRKTQLTRPVPPTSPVPEAIDQLHRQALAGLWQAAQERAEAAHRATQAEWEGERAEADTLNRQLADAYEVQATELVRLQESLAQEQGHRAQEAIRIEGLVRQLEAMDHAVHEARAQADRTEARATEIAHRAADLHTALERAHADIIELRVEVADTRGQADALHTTLAELQAERDAARLAVSQAREDTAMLRGQVAALQEQHATMLATLQFGGGKGD